MEAICAEKHKRIDEKLELSEKRINDHSKRIDILEQNDARKEENIKGLVKELSSLNKTLRWFIGLMLGGTVTFFFTAIQKGVF